MGFNFFALVDGIMQEKVKKVYIETSVVGGYGRKRFHDTTTRR